MALVYKQVLGASASELAFLMGNCVAHYRHRKGSCIRIHAGKNKQVLQVVKIDGKVLKFRAPILVKDILLYFSGSGIGLSKEALEHLPPSYELKLGNTCYILPRLSSVVKGTASVGGGSAKADGEEISSVKRIKVVITKQELRQLLTKQLSAEEFLLGAEKTSDSVGSPRNWKPKLEAIPE